jgi:hypothetical protein
MATELWLNPIPFPCILPFLSPDPMDLPMVHHTQHHLSQSPPFPKGLCPLEWVWAAHFSQQPCVHNHWPATHMDVTDAQREGRLEGSGQRGSNCWCHEFLGFSLTDQTAQCLWFSTVTRLSSLYTGLYTGWQTRQTRVFAWGSDHFYPDDYAGATPSFTSLAWSHIDTFWFIFMTA